MKASFKDYCNPWVLIRPKKRLEEKTANTSPRLRQISILRKREGSCAVRVSAGEEESQREGNGTESWKELMCCACECRGGRGSLGLTCGPKFRGSLLENKMMKKI